MKQGLKVVKNGKLVQETAQQRDERMFNKLTPEQRGWVLELGASAHADAILMAGDIACTFAFFFGQEQCYFPLMPIGGRLTVPSGLILP